ncbi:response regulator [Acidaminobacter sp. JC074]|uniref:response regulator n=1 Tax=Acidaminobacter sp. JC074 TaxID=2530199 RepID=UPI001F0F6438|nr:response regulator [Acidaminobacter sp. JC074]
MSDKIKVVVIDDNHDILFTVKEICEFCGYTVFTADQGETGYKLALKEKPQLIIIDYHMPGWDGLLTVKKITKDLPQAAILVLTVDENQETAENFLNAGATDFAIKPIKAPDLIARMKINLQLQNMQSQNTVKQEQEYIEKGISAITLEKIETFMRNENSPVTIHDVSIAVELSYKTVHRYIQYLVENNKAETIHQYGTVGRPKNRYQIL